MDTESVKRRERNKREALTDKVIAKAKPAEKPYKLTDGNGLYMLITPSGGKLWRWKYTQGGKEKVLALGSYPTVTLSEARTACAEERRKLFAGVDPAAQRKADKIAQAVSNANSFKSVALLWWEQWRKARTPHHADAILRRMEQNIFPHLGHRPITEIEAPELVAMAKAVQARGVVDLPKRTMQNSNQIFRYAIAHGLAKRNPAAEIRPSDVLASHTPKNLARIESKELPDLLRHIDAYQGSPVTRLAIRLMALTFVRTSELIGAQWAEIDLEAARWDIPAARMKKKTPHIVPLSQQAINILETLKLISGGGVLVFPGERNPAKPMSNNTILKALERMGYKGKMTGHGFRGLASTLLHEQGYNHEHIELQLAHINRDEVSAAYNHALYLEPRAKMMQEWADYLDLTQRGVKVLTLRQAAA